MHISLVSANTTTIEVFLSLNFVYFFQMSICHALAAVTCFVDVVQETVMTLCSVNV